MRIKAVHFHSHPHSTHFLLLDFEFTVAILLHKSTEIMQTRYVAVFLLIALIMIEGFSAIRMDDSSDSDQLERFMRGGIDVACTADCAKWWQCRITGLFIKKCNKPSECNCSEFAWERK